VRDTVFARLREMLPRVMRPGDRAAVVYWDPGLARAHTILQATGDVERVGYALQGVELAQLADSENIDEQQFGTEVAFFEKIARSGVAVDVVGQIETTRNFSEEYQLQEFRRKTASFNQLVVGLAAAPGRKSILYLSNSFALPGDLTGRNSTIRISAIRMLEDLARTANAGGVTFYAIRPAIPGGDNNMEQEAPAVPLANETADRDEFDRSLAALRRLTDRTGGALEIGLASAERIVPKLAADIGSYYSLAYRAQTDGSDRERRIRVRTKNRAWNVRARESFVEKSDESFARETLLSRLFAEDGGTDIDFTIEEKKERRLTGDRWILPVVLHIPSDALQFVKEGSEDVALVKIFTVAANDVSEVTKITEDRIRVVHGRHDPGNVVVYSMEILGDSRGSKVSIGVFDVNSGLAGVRTIDNRDRFGRKPGL
jgi:VWFA-related protein